MKDDVKIPSVGKAGLGLEGGAAVEEARTRRALLHMLEDLQEERRLADRAREQWLKTVDALRDPLVVHDEQFRVLRCNSAYAQRAGMAIPAILGKRCWECFPRDMPREAWCLEVGVERGQSRREITLSSGEVYNVRRFAINQGEAKAWLVMFEDITERKSQQREIEFKNLILSTQMETSLDGILVVDQGGGVLSVNRRFVEMWGIDEALAHSGSGDRMLESVRDRLVDPMAFRAEVSRLRAHPEAAHRGEVRLQDGRIFESHCACMTAPQGGPSGRVWYFRDVTERVRAEQALHASEARYRATFDQAAVGVVHNAPDGRFLRVNRKYCEMLGYSEADLLQRRFHDIVHPEDLRYADRLRQQFMERAAPAQAPAFEHREVCSDGRIIWTSVAVTMVRDGKGDPDYFVAVVQDVTERKLAEDRIRRLNRVYAVLSGINNIIVRVRDRQELFDAACRIAVEEGRFISAAIAEYDLVAERLAAVAQRGAFEGFSADGVSTRSDARYAAATMVRAVRERRPVWDDDLAKDPDLGPNRARNIDAGARSMISLPLFLADQVAGVLVLFAPEKDFFDNEEIRLLSEMAGDISHALDYIDQARRATESEVKLAHSLKATIEAIAATLESRDPYTAGHQKRVADLAVAIAREMGLSPNELVGIHFGALIHDLGKIQVPAELLSKPTRLTRLEFELIKTHPQAGYDIIKGIDFPWPVAAMVHQHHERLDGSGYPQGLQGEEIALEARILAVADVVEAIASHRPYRPGLGIETALKEIADKRGSVFDERAVEACLRLFREKGFALSPA